MRKLIYCQKPKGVVLIPLVDSAKKKKTTGGLCFLPPMLYCTFDARVSILDKNYIYAPL